MQPAEISQRLRAMAISGHEDAEKLRKCADDLDHEIIRYHERSDSIQLEILNRVWARARVLWGRVSSTGGV